MSTVENVQHIITTHLATALYFSAPTCNVCHALKPKLEQMFSTKFSQLSMHSFNIEEDLEVAAHFQVFTIPTLLIFFEGREFIRKSRHMSVVELEQSIARPYDMLYN